MEEEMTSNQTQHVSPSGIAEMAGVGRSTVSNWRRRHGDFPSPVAGSADNPLFDLGDVQNWLSTRRAKTSTKVSTSAGIRGLLNGLRADMASDDLLLLTAAFLAYLHVSRRSKSIPNSSDDYLARLPARLWWTPKSGPELFTAAQNWIDETPYPNRNLKLFVDTLSNLTGESHRLQHVLSGIDELTRAKPLAPVLENLIAGRGDRWTRSSVDMATSIPLCGLLLDLVWREPGPLVDPACGIGEVLLTAAARGGSHLLRGYDIDPYAATIASARSVLHDYSIDIGVEDALGVTHVRGNMEAHAVIVDPPIGTKEPLTTRLGDPRWVFGQPQGRAEWAWLQDAIYQLQPDGRAAVVTSKSLLAEHGTGAVIRQELVRQGALEAAISLPRAISAGSMELAVWILCRPGRAADPSSVLFIDGTDSANEASNPADISWISEAYHSWRSGREISAIEAATTVPILDLLAPGATLDPSRWATPAPDPVDLEQNLNKKLLSVNAVRDALVSMPELPTITLAPMTTDVVKVTVEQLRIAGHLQVRRRPLTDTTSTGRTTDGEELITPDNLDIILERSTRRTSPIVPQDSWSTRPGDLLVFARGERMHTRVVQVAGLNPSPAIQVVRVQPKYLDARYVGACLESRWNRKFLNGRPTLRPKLEGFEIPLLPIGDQSAIGQRLAMWDQLQTLTASVASGLAELNLALTDALTSGVLSLGPAE
jgi:hypothetical protein